MPTLEVEFEVFCSCGSGLCSSTRVSYRNGRTQITVEPCEGCLAEAREKGDTAGYDRGCSDGREEQE